MTDFTCPHCKRTLKIPEEYLGQKGRCNHCGCGITVPEANGLPPAPPPDSNALLTPHRNDELRACEEITIALRNAGILPANPQDSGPSAAGKMPALRQFPILSQALSRRARRFIVAFVGLLVVVLIGGIVLYELAERARVKSETQAAREAQAKAAVREAQEEAVRELQERAAREAKERTEAKRESAAKLKAEARRVAEEIKLLDKKIADSDEKIKRYVAEFNERRQKMLDTTFQNTPPARIAKMSVELTLKAPATAKFGRFPFITDLGNGQYEVFCYVDAQNDFGALLRSYYTAVVRDTGDKGVGLDGWVCDSLDMD